MTLNKYWEDRIMELIDIAVLMIFAHAVNVFCFIILMIRSDKIRDKLKNLIRENDGKSRNRGSEAVKNRSKSSKTADFVSEAPRP